ncbi:MAG: Rrf2 family transcriptional regulator [Gammaproteobacteria bacterium]|nr:Rrf2 family transcriptional regulator [Gammaproteobacteria bacterium]OYY23577.1 MAG: hypothetical protein B7Y68_05770 [Thiotrichales bacterium 35-46-9]OYZ07384.1 MAG: hypothetical protein B7Y29_04700 [Thiotrichales bacterium 16-46-22]OZA19925.1 MAG: hypothetical protein B7X85_01730 [Thiotrichales bacterium 17-46-47]OZA97937.1 MAG: hypothetical protein B7X52_01565 [Thiotrichales bacterium 34-46-19]UCG18350.1 MAG: Rrf2 family transcriptional regulator [Thiotrichales bacterium]
MHITKFTDYALRVLLTLVTLSSEEQLQVKPLAKSLGISENHLIKIVHQLGKLGWIITYRGRGGGFVLAEFAKQLTVGDIVRQLEPNMQPLDCQSGYCPLLGNCTLALLMHDAKQSFLSTLDHMKLVDLVANQRVKTEANTDLFYEI